MATHTQLGWQRAWILGLLLMVTCAKSSQLVSPDATISGEPEAGVE